MLEYLKWNFPLNLLGALLRFKADLFKSKHYRNSLIESKKFKDFYNKCDKYLRQKQIFSKANFI